MEIRRGLMMGMANKLPAFIGKLSGGSFTLELDLNNTNYPAESIYPYAKMPIEHGLGAVPTGIIVYRFTGDLTNQSTEQMAVVSAYIYNPTGSTGDWVVNAINLYTRSGKNATVSQQSSATTGICNITDTSFKIRGASTTPYKAGVVYYWIAWTQSI